MRLRCRLLGCTSGEFNECHRCGHQVYDPDYVEAGWLEPVFRWWWRVRRWFSTKRWYCTQCGKRLPWRRQNCVSEEFCSDECFSKWLPF